MAHLQAPEISYILYIKRGMCTATILVSINLSNHGPQTAALPVDRSDKPHVGLIVVKFAVALPTLSVLSLATLE